MRGMAEGNAKGC